jgi:hypothetical protein
MRRNYRVRPGKGVSAFGAIGALVFLIGGCALMNSSPVRPPAVFQFIWVAICVAGLANSLYNAVSDSGIASEVIQEEVIEDNNSPREPARDTASMLRELESLRAEGLVTEEEYQAKRQAVLSKFG